jgi:hypothetical protein
VLLLLYHFRQKELAVLMSFYFLLFASDTWFWMNNEVHQGIAWMFLLFGTTLSMGKKGVYPLLQTVVFILIAFLALYTHPLLLFPTSYLWLFLSSRKEWPYTRKQTLIFSAILLLIALSKLYWSSGASSHYDAEKLLGIKRLSFATVINVLHSSFARELFRRMMTAYWMVPLVFLAGLAALWLNRAWWLLVLTVGYALLYLIAICLTFTDFIPFYAESELMPATIILTAPFVYFFLRRLPRRSEVILLAIIFSLRLSVITAAAPKWIARKEWLLNTLAIMQKQNSTKGLVLETEANKKLLLLTWGTPAESLLASALQGESPQRTFVVDNPENFSQRLPANHATIIGSFEQIPFSTLNPTYFRFDTTAGYRLLNVR